MSAGMISRVLQNFIRLSCIIVFLSNTSYAMHIAATSFVGNNSFVQDNLNPNVLWSKPIGLELIGITVYYTDGPWQSYTSDWYPNEPIVVYVCNDDNQSGYPQSLSPEFSDPQLEVYLRNLPYQDRAVVPNWTTLCNQCNDSIENDTFTNQEINELCSGNVAYYNPETCQGHCSPLPDCNDEYTLLLATCGRQDQIKEWSNTTCSGLCNDNSPTNFGPEQCIR